MSKYLIQSIKNDYEKISNLKISNKKVEKYILPILLFINESNSNTFLIAGAQGIGKSTLTKIISKNFYKFFKKRVLTISLDDFYFSHNHRMKLSKLIHPLFKIRGVPGTHDINRINKIINNFIESRYPIYLPIFDKLKDNRITKKKIIKQKSDILILEGWCCGAMPLKKNYLFKNINLIEKNNDKNFIWRKYYNNQLKNEYALLFQRFDKLIYFKAPSFNHVLSWRLKAEKKLTNSINKTYAMNKYEISEFIQHYEKITRWMMKTMPTSANLTISVDKNQQIKRISIV